MSRLLAAFAIILCVGCGSEDAETERAPAPSDPAEVGPYAVGVTTLEVTSEGRTLPVEVWYPAEASPTGEVVGYDVKIGPLKLATLPSAHGAVRDARLDRRGGPHPVVLFSHGNGGMRVQSIYLTEYLATHGFVVAAPDHVGNTLAEQVNQSGLPPAEAARVRPLDISRTLDAVLAESSRTDGVLAGAADAERVGVAGHSFGGYTAFRLAGATLDVAAVTADCAGGGNLFCSGWDELGGPFPESARDERIRVALPQTPGGAQIMNAGGNDGFAAIEIPVFVQGGTTDDTTPFEPESRAPYARLSGPAWLLGIDRAGHFTFSNVCELLELAAIEIDQLSDGCTAEDIAWRDAHSIAVSHATAFFQVELRGHAPLAPFLEPPAALPPGVAVFEKRAP